jgi:hypothetical protein
VGSPFAAAWFLTSGVFAAVGNIALIAAPISAAAWFLTSGVRYGKIAERKEIKIPNL